MPILTIDLFGRITSVFSILFIILTIFIIALTVNTKKIRTPNKYALALILWLSIAMISLLFGATLFSAEPDWLAKIYSYIPKTLILAEFALTV